MKAIAIIPGKGDPQLIEIEEPVISLPDEIKLKVLQVGICGTDREEVEGGRAEAPDKEGKLIIGHEMLGVVTELGSSVQSFKKGDFAVVMVRRPCMICQPCRNGRSDMCLTGKYKERGIKGLHGFQAEYVIDKEEFAVKVPESIKDIGVLTEPASVIVKAIDEAVKLQGVRLPGTDSETYLQGKKALVAGLGPIGLLSSFVLKLRGAEVFGLDIMDEDSPRPQIFKEAGGIYINGKKTNAEEIDNKCGKMDFVLDATGIAKLEFQLLDALGFNGIYVLTGIPEGDRPLEVSGAVIIRQLVLMNQIVLGSVNAAKAHYLKAVEDLADIKKRWPDTISKVISEKVSYMDYMRAVTHNPPDEIKTVVEW